MSKSSSPSFTVPETGTIATKWIPAGQPVRGDGDADNPSDLDGNGDSDSARVGGPDPDQDYPVPASYRFPDQDDRATFAYGRRPSARVGRAIAGVVEHYYAAAAAGDGASACKLLEPNLARSVPENFAGPGAPAYMRGAGRTCGAVLAAFYGHFHHEELAAPIKVAAVRVHGVAAQAIFASRALRASAIFLSRRDGSWRLSEVLGRPLP